MKCYIQIFFLLTIIAVNWIDEVKCKPRKQFLKNINIENTFLPIKHVPFILEKITPFGKYKYKHVIHKRQALSEVPLVPREIPVIEGTLDDFVEKKEVPLDNNSGPKVIITSIVKPVENGKSLSVSIPFDSRFVITPYEKPHEIVETPVNEVIENESKLAAVAPNAVQEVFPPVKDIIPKPTEILLPPEPPVEPNVLINSVVESSVPPLVRIPLYRNSIFPFVNPVIGNVGKAFMYTDITQIPLKTAPYASPVVVPISEVILPPQPPPPLPVPPPPVPPPSVPIPAVPQPAVPPPAVPPPAVPPPPVIKEDPPPTKQEPPNIFVKGSRLVLYVGSMMLQMLSRLVDGGFNINQIPIPIIPGMN